MLTDPCSGRDSSGRRVASSWVHCLPRASDQTGPPHRLQAQARRWTPLQGRPIERLALSARVPRCAQQECAVDLMFPPFPPRDSHLLLLPEDWAAQNLGLRGREATAVVHSASSSPSERANALHPRSLPFFRLKKPFELVRTRLDGFRLLD